MRFGIEGEHWVINDKGEKTFEGSKRNVGSNIGEWGFRHWYAPTLGNVLIADAPPSMVGPNNELQTLLREANDNTHMPSHMGFVMNQEPLLTEIAAVNAVVQEYTNTVQWGQLPNEAAVVQMVDEFNAKLYANGLQKIIDGISEQTAAWRTAR
jgi:putative aldouronate transport system substrate-binding protein